MLHRQQVLRQAERESVEVLERDLEPLKKIKKPFVRLSYDEAVIMIQDIQRQTEDEEQKRLSKFMGHGFWVAS